VVQYIISIVGIFGFFSIVTVPPWLVQYAAAGDPDWVVGYSIALYGATGASDHGIVQAERIIRDEAMRRMDRIEK
jgi:hypothetical protein